ncbi:5-formyltetrahydrofolate cyclo-ligase [Endozoicomonas sp. G2_2]|uniref:5-formyltetrahydrofolate cyclo-ligase n=1 Tax=Endozoicomonas sp. G2_2 TaxID=2821092 RepID=UPI001AD9C467|nr:5-formyltetrahydrofolate cyclo-ligase [Endozoicomonas sp. G2_2]MBO9471822.1 5-formyltetrahydrofolate cyclo-ligase [Endozoicomonas sp. G2_2]
MNASVPDQRKSALRARRALAPARARTASRDACRRIARLPLFRRARRIGLYWPMSREADPRPLLDALAPRQQAFLPRVIDHQLRFVAIDSPGFRHRRSALGITEPLGGPLRPVTCLDLLIVPLAGFDAAARRIGMGGGFYDRTLAQVAASGGFRGPRLIGLAFDTQRLARIETRPWDVALDAVVSESAVHRRATCPQALR